VRPPADGPVVALLPWGRVIEEFLEPIGLDPERFASEMSGGWLFGWIEGIGRAGGRGLVVCPSSSVRAPRRLVHAETGAAIWLVPPTAISRILRRAALAVEGAGRLPVLGRSAARVVNELEPWFATPPVALARVLRQERVTAIVCQEYTEARLDVCEVVGRILGVPVWATFQGGSSSPTAGERALRRWTVRRARGLLIGSSAERRRVVLDYGVDAALIADVPNPIDVDAWVPADRDAARRALGIAPEARVVSWYGRVDRHRKGLDVLSQAWRQVVGKPGAGDPGVVGPGEGEAVLLLTGTGPDVAALDADLRGLPGVRRTDRYTTDRAELRRQLAACDVAVLPSRHEGFAVTLLEAMACGRPVVAADVPGVRDVVPGGEDDGCVVVPVGDADALARAVGDLLADPERAERMGRAGRRRAVDHYAVDAVGRRLLEVLADRRGPVAPRRRRPSWMARRPRRTP
jgi:glycosyltransferase involved in cell wall biosynthesis